MPIASAFRSALLVFGLALTAIVTPAVWAQGSSAADGFNPNVDGNVYAVTVQPDGKVLIAGSFQNIQPNGAISQSAHSNIARVLADGREDSGFSPSVNGQINAMIVQPDGKIVIGGKFTAVGGVARLRLARLNSDGSVDASFSPAIEPRDATANPDASLVPDVSALALQADGKIVVGGGFKYVQPNGGAEVSRNRIVRFNPDGSLDTSFDPNANGAVLALAVQADGKIIVGGGFTTINPARLTTAPVRNRIVRLNEDGTLDASFDPNANNAISAIEILPDGSILIGGTFTSLSPNGDTTPTTTGCVRVARLNSSDGRPSDGFSGNVDGPVSVLKRQSDGRILVGGSFGTVGGSSRPFMARMYPSGGLDTTFSAGVNFNVYAIAVQPNGSIVMGGGFITVRGSGASSVVRNHVARISPSGALDADFRPDSNGRLRSLLVQSDGKILVGGSFTSVGGQTRSGIVRLNTNGSVDTTFTTNVNGGVITAVQQADKKIVIAGTFSRVNGTARSYIARLNEDGSLDANYDPSANSTINAMLLQSDGRLLIGGAFTMLAPQGTTEGVARSYLARLNADGSLDTAYTAQTNDVVWALAAQSDGKVVVGGAFGSVLPTGTTTAVSSRLSMMRLNADGTLDTGFDPHINGTVYAVAVQSDGAIVFGGNFLQLAPNGATTITDRNRIARVAADGTVDATFDPNLDNIVTTIKIQSDDKILIGGGFTSLKPNGDTSGVPRYYAARLLKSGLVDDSFNLYLDVTPGNQVVALALTSGNKILVGGAFSVIGVGRTPRNRIAQVNADGSVDTTFNADTAVAGGVPIAALTLQYDGQILAAGTFSNINGAGSSNIARFNPDGVPDAYFVPNINGSLYAIAEGPIKGTPIPTQRGGFAWLEGNGQLRTGFSFGSEVVSAASIVTSAVQPNDGKVLIAGTFSITRDGADVAASLVRFNTDGTVDSSFKLTTSGTVNVIRVQSDGKILIGGTFTTVDSQTRNNIARLNADGSVDTTFSVAADAVVQSIAFQSDGKIVLVGGFTSIAPSGGTTYTGRNYIARLNADLTIDTGFDPKANAAIQSVLIQADGKMVVAGGFTTFQPNGASATTARNFIARLNADGTVEAADLKSNGFVATLVAQDTKILVAGYFTNIAGSPRSYVARLNSDLTIDATFNPNPNLPVLAVAVQGDGKILIGGSFSALQPGSNDYDPAVATPRNRAARLNADGSIDPSFNPNFDSTVGVFVPVADGSIIVTGGFSTIQPNGSLLIAGSFTSINGVAATNLALLGSDGSVSSTFIPNPNGAVNAVLQQTDGSFIVGGAFTQIAGNARNRIARFSTDNSLDTSFNPNAGGEVFALAFQADGKILVGGSFATIAGSSRTNLARLNADGSLDASFSAPGGIGAVRSIALQTDGRILFTNVTGTGTNRLGRLNADGTNDGSFAVSHDGEVTSIAVQTNGKITVGGSFTQIAGVSEKKYLARLNADGTIDTSVTSQPNGAVTALTLQRDGKIVIGGTFSTVDGLQRFGLARVSASPVSSDSFSTNAARNTVTWTRSGAAPEISAVLFEWSPDSYTWTSLGTAVRVSGTSNWRISNVSLDSTALYIRARAISPSSPNGSSGLIETRGYLAPSDAPSAPVITSATAVSTAAGSGFLYAISATGNPTAFSATGLPAGLSLNPSTGIISGTPTVQGTYTIVLTATNGSGSSSITLTLIVGAPGSTTNEGRIVNLSVNAQIGPTNPIVFTGFVISGSNPQNVLIRVVGPGLKSVGVNDPVLALPKLELFNSAGVSLNQNQSWGGGVELTQAFVRLGAFPLDPNSADAALLVTLAPGPYTVQVSDRGTSGGAVLAEIYDAQPNPPPANSPRLVNISARGVVNSGQLVTGGFVISGTTAKKILIRGVGPGLTAYNVPGVLADPSVVLNKITNGTSAVIAKNDNWETPVVLDAAYPPSTATQIAAAAAVTGAFALDAGSKDSAILVTLAPGIYTAQVSGAGSSSGAALVEVYEVP